MVDQLPGGGFDESGFEQFADDQADFAFNQEPDIPFPEEETIPLPPERPTEAIQNEEAVNAFDAQPDSWPEPTYVFENPYAVSPEEQQTFIEQDARTIAADAENERAAIALNTIDAADWPEPEMRLSGVESKTPAFIGSSPSGDCKEEVMMRRRSFPTPCQTRPLENETPYPVGTVEEAPLPPPPAAYDFYGESIGNYDAAEQGFQNYNYFSADNPDAWNAIALNENNADFFYGDNAAEFSEVAANDNLFSDFNYNTGVADENLTDLSNDIADQQADFAFNQQPDVPFPEEETIPLPPERPAEAIQNEQADRAFNAQPDSWPEPTYVFENPYAVSPEEQQAFIEQDSRTIVSNAENERAQIALNTIDAADWPEPRMVENLDKFTNAFELTPEEQQKAVAQASQDILDQQADLAFNQQPDVAFPEQESIPLPPERPTEAIQNADAVNAFNAQPSTEDFNAQEAYDAWQSFYAQPSAEDVVGQETADANQAFNAQYDAEPYLNRKSSRSRKDVRQKPFRTTKL